MAFSLIGSDGCHSETGRICAPFSFIREIFPAADSLSEKFMKGRSSEIENSGTE